MSSLATLHSGGAEGADALFAACASQASHSIVIHTFKGHSSKLPKSIKATLSKSPPETDAFLDDYLKIANASIHRRLPTSSYILNLLRRSVLIAKNSTSLYAVGQFLAGTKNRTPTLPQEGDLVQPLVLSSGSKDVGIERGTAWGCQVFADQFTMTGDDPLMPMFFFDQKSNAWYQGRKDPQTAFISWVLIANPPSPTGAYAGIGTRDLLKQGSAAIESLYTGNTIETHSTLVIRKE